MGFNLRAGRGYCQALTLHLLPPARHEVSLGPMRSREYFFEVFDFLKSRPDLEDPEYQMVLEREEDGTFVATSPALPGYVAHGPSEAAAARKLRRAIRRHLKVFAADHLAASREPPQT